MCFALPLIRSGRPVYFIFFYFFQSAFLILPEVSRLTCAAHMQPMHICPTQSNRGGQASAQGHSVAQGRTFKNSRVCLCALQTHHMIKSASPRSFTLRRGNASVSSQPGFARARKLRGRGGKQNMHKCMRCYLPEKHLVQYIVWSVLQTQRLARDPNICSCPSGPRNTYFRELSHAKKSSAPPKGGCSSDVSGMPTHSRKQDPESTSWARRTLHTNPRYS